MKDERSMMNECWTCKHKRPVPGNCHIRCDKPDENMTGDLYGRSEGWFFYPSCFDPTWKTSDCTNYESNGE